MTLLTMILPAGATLALDFGLSRGRFAWGWRRARKEDRQYTRQHEQTARTLEAAQENLAQALTALERQGDERAAVFQQAYELGRATGARRGPFWNVALKIAVAVFLSLAGVLTFAILYADVSLAQAGTSALGRLAIYLLAAFGTAGVYAMFAVKAWFRPNERQLWDQRGPVWRGAVASASLSEFSQAGQRAPYVNRSRSDGLSPQSMRASAFADSATGSTAGDGGSNTNEGIQHRELSLRRRVAQPAGEPPAVPVGSRAFSRNYEPFDAGVEGTSGTGGNGRAPGYPEEIRFGTNPPKAVTLNPTPDLDDEITQVSNHAA
jgi:hypothetical protein